MTTLHRVKAYFGMVPADELDSYDGYDDDRYDSERDRRPVDRHTGDRHPVDRHRYAADRFDDRFDDRDGGYDRYGRGRRDDREDRDDQERYDRYDRYEERRTPRPRDPEVTEIRREDVRREEEPATETVSRAGRGRSWAHNTVPSHTSVRPTTHRIPPSLSSASSTGSSGPASSSTASDTAATPAVKGPTAVPSVAAADPDPASGPAEITSLQPKSYNEARLIGERYRDGIPVIMNLTEMDDAGAKRLVDFAAGLAFALRGSIEKVTNRVFLLSPPNVEVSASDRRKLAEKNYASTS
jgi:cell division inhibitor SepF